MSLKRFRKMGQRIWRKHWRKDPKESQFLNNFELGRARMEAREDNFNMKQLARQYERRENKRIERESFILDYSTIE